MICVECGCSNIDALFSRYKSDYIRLKICPDCGRVADKYIEFDNVILFLDLLLLKPQAYRHIAFNESEREIVRVNKEYELEHGAQDLNTFTWSRSLLTYKKLFRFLLMSLLFEVYLTWAYEEKKSTHSESMKFVLAQAIHTQYFYFVLKSLSEVVFLNFSVQYIFHTWLRWGETKSMTLPSTGSDISATSQQGYSIIVLLVTISISSSVKLFPIVMLIWPYDNITDSTIFINLVAFFNIIEATKLVTNKKYSSIILTMFASTLISQVASKVLMGAFSSYISGLGFLQVMKGEYAELLINLHSYEQMLYKTMESVLNI